MNFSSASQSAFSTKAIQLRWASSPQRDDENRLIPLINVVFLMLIFFLLVGSIRPPEPQAVNPPVSTVDQARASQAITVTVDAQSRLFVNDAPSELSALASKVRETRGSGLAKSHSNVILQDLTPLKIEIRADKTLTMRSLGPIIRALSTVGADELSLITQR